jgi:hypothetical protein
MGLGPEILFGLRSCIILVCNSTPMKPLLFLMTALFVWCRYPAQESKADSLIGFNEAAAAIEAHQRNFNTEDVKSFVKWKQREFLKSKFNLQDPPPSVSLGSKPGSGPVVIANPPCLNEGFEGLPQGPLSAAGWTTSTASIFPGSLFCPQGVPVFSSGNAAAAVSITPILDPNCNNVTTSPFGGSNVVKLTGGPPVSGIPHTSRMAQTFLVTASNFIYLYAYKAYADNIQHVCCDSPSLIFNYYDCSGNLIAALSKSVIPNMAQNCGFNFPYWTLGVFSAHTPNWVLLSTNLAPYIGSCVTVQVTASGCNGFSHGVYCYYDALCADQGLIANGTVLTGGSYTSCAASNTLGALPGFSSFLWQGPANSGVSGLTSSVVTTGTSGNYTLTASIGTVVTTQTMNLQINAPSPPTIVGSSSVCAGTTVSLQVQGNGLTSYTWSTNSNSISVTDTPAATTVYSVSVTNSLGCTSSDSKTVTVMPSPTLSINAATLAVCMGQSVGLSIASAAAISYTWSHNSSTSSSVVASPMVTTVYTVNATSVDGCTATATNTISVFPNPLLMLTAASPSVCLGQSVTLSASPSPGSYLWSTGSTAQTIVVSPSVSTIYSGTITSAAGCNTSASVPILVYAVPQIQITAPSSVICLGTPINLTASVSPNSTILWNTGAINTSIIETPTVNSVYTATVTYPSSCQASASVAVTVNALPSVMVSSSQSVICNGESVVLTASSSPVMSYQWSEGSGTPSISVSPSLTTLYTATVTDNNGCSASAAQNIQVFACTGMETYLSDPDASIHVFPNPTEDAFTIRSSKAERGTIVNGLGQIVAAFNLSEANNFSQRFSDFAAGAYVIRTTTAVIKVIVE